MADADADGKDQHDDVNWHGSQTCRIDGVHNGRCSNSGDWKFTVCAVDTKSTIHQAVVDHVSCEITIALMNPLHVFQFHDGCLADLSSYALCLAGREL